MLWDWPPPPNSKRKTHLSNLRGKVCSFIYPVYHFFLTYNVSTVSEIGSGITLLKLWDKAFALSLNLKYQEKILLSTIKSLRSLNYSPKAFSFFQFLPLISYLLLLNRWNWIISALIPRVTTDNSFETKQTAFRNSKAINGLIGIFTARRMKAAKSFRRNIR